MGNHHKFDDSTSISHIDYDDAKSKLEIKFISGTTYIYDDCPKDHHHGMKNAESAGKYFRTHILGKFNHTKV